jgi:predicted ATPase
MIKRGEPDRGVPMLRASLDTCMESGWTAWFTEFLAILAEGLIALQHYDEAAAAIAQALDRSAQGGEDWYLPELYRLKGRLALCQRDLPDDDGAEVCYRQSLDKSIEQGALFWQLRAAVDLAQLKKRQDLTIEAREILGSVYDRFTEGFETPDLQAARALLSSLQ